MRTPAGPARGAADDEGTAGAAERRAVALGRSVAVPVVLAVSTFAAVAGAVLALLPTVLRRRPAGRPGGRRDDDRAAVAAEAAGEPLAP